VPGPSRHRRMSGWRGRAIGALPRSWVWWLLLADVVIWLLLGTVVQPRLGSFAMPYLRAAAPLLVLLLLLVVVLVVVHELGHLLADLLLDFRVLTFRVGPFLVATLARVQLVKLGPFTLVHTRSGWGTKVERHRLRWDVRAHAGSVQSVPRTPDRLRARHAASIAAGPLAGLLVAVVPGAVAVVTGNLPLAVLSGILALLALAELIPTGSAQGSWSDGRWLLCWLLHPERARYHLTVGTLRAQRALGERPRAWGDERWIDLAARAPDPSCADDDLRGCQLAYYLALDHGLAARACELAGRAFELRPRAVPSARPLLAVEHAFCLARFQADPVAAERVLAEVEGSEPGPNPLDLDRARAALHLAAGRPAEALAACERILGDVRIGDASRGLAAMIRELVEAMRDEAARLVAVGEAAG